MLVITKNLVLQKIEANNWKHDDLGREITTCWALFFRFHGIDGFSAFITDEKIDLPYANYGLIESDEGDLHESFSDQIENHWNSIVEAVKKWEVQHFKVHTSLIQGIENNRIEAGLV